MSLPEAPLGDMLSDSFIITKSGLYKTNIHNLFSSRLVRTVKTGQDYEGFWSVSRNDKLID